MKRVFTPEHRRALSEAAKRRVQRDPTSVITTKGRRHTRKAKLKMKLKAAERWAEVRRRAWEAEVEWARAEGRPEPKWNPMKPVRKVRKAPVKRRRRKD